MSIRLLDTSFHSLNGCLGICEQQLEGLDLRVHLATFFISLHSSFDTLAVPGNCCAVGYGITCILWCHGEREGLRQNFRQFVKFTLTPIGTSLDNRALFAIRQCLLWGNREWILTETSIDDHNINVIDDMYIVKTRTYLDVWSVQSTAWPYCSKLFKWILISRRVTQV